MMTVLILAALAALGFLGWTLSKRRGAKHIAGFNDRRRAAAQLVGTATFVDGNRHLPVALAVTNGTFFYESDDLEASLDLDRIREVEYDTELATGLAIASGKVLRLRSDSQTFEFVLPADTAAAWQAMLPAREAIAPPPAVAIGNP